MSEATSTAVQSAPANSATPWLATVPVLASIFADAGKTPGAVRMDIWKAEDRKNSRGEVIRGNGLAQHHAIVRNGRKVLLIVPRYGNWLAGRPPIQS